MIQKMLDTNNSYAALFLRLALALSILPHGVQKLSNVSGTLEALHTFYGIPTILGVFVIFIELLSPILLIIGFFTRVNAALLGIVILGAAFFHLEHGFYINWLGNQAGEGFQFHLLFVLASAAAVVLGGGKGSIDLILNKIFINKNTTK